MAEEFEGRDLSEAVFWGVDLSRATFCDVNLTEVSISRAWLVNVAVDGLVDHLTINGVDVTEFVNERDPWFPLRGMLRPTDPEALASTWSALEQEWNGLLSRAGQLSSAQRRTSVDGEWSFVDTLRHLVFCMDKWFSVPVLGDDSFHPIGVPNSGSADFGWPGIDPAADPSYDEVLAVCAQRGERFRSYLDAVSEADFTREVDVLENGPHPLRECLFVVFEESFEHLRYANRDLGRLEPTHPAT